MRPNPKTCLAPWAIAVLAAMAWPGCHQSATDSMAGQDTAQYILPDSLFRTLTIDTVGLCPVVHTVTLTGQVDFNEDKVVKIYPLVSGTVSDVEVMLGDYVTKGEVMAKVNSSEMAGYSSNLISAQTNLAVAKKNLEATLDMYHGGLASSRDSLSAVATYDQALAELRRIQSVLAINGGGDSATDVIRAPISGFIVEKFLTNNTVIRPDFSTNLFTISDLKEVWVIANVYESNIADIHLGDSVHITTLAYPGKDFPGKVNKIMNVLDPTNKVMKVRIVISNPGYLLKPEMFASVKVSNPEHRELLCVPQQAVVFDNSQYYVLVYHSNRDIRITPVKVETGSGERYYITSGLKQGDRVICSQTILIYQALNT
ncbi:MAG TPA: efflux RND transporter periplasmic adaptor subunit [Chitinophagaceae bacterium]|nr:efflux RND transporter periplasmic adaptor subunit [Chitinophagaceae bacterium]